MNRYLSRIGRLMGINVQEFREVQAEADLDNEEIQLDVVQPAASKIKATSPRTSTQNFDCISSEDGHSGDLSDTNSDSEPSPVPLTRQDSIPWQSVDYLIFVAQAEAEEASTQEETEEESTDISDSSDDSEQHQLMNEEDEASTQEETEEELDKHI
uniref:Uncharacterized protein n=1 Tax=Ditylenchus dipsaci TaxID=166011 RepID=A0A915E722_9BILA